MDPLVALATFAVIFPAELPDKSMFAAVVMGTRYKPSAVWLGLAGAFLLHVVIAVSAGQAITLLPHKVVAAVVTSFFIGGGVYLFVSSEKREEEAGESEANNAGADGGSTGLSPVRTVAASFGVIFVSELGDLTQIATVNLAARYDDAISVGVGAVAALWLVTGLGVLLGKRLVRSIPLDLVRRGAGVVLLALGAWSLIDFLRM